jgi:sugar phosphate isomerase/epimerase
MQTVLFTKLFHSRSLDEVASVTAGLGFDGVDLLVRKGFHIDPAQPQGIAAAVRLLQVSGLQVPMATCDLNDPSSPVTEPLLGALAQAGIGTLRLGYWRYDPAQGYIGYLDEARRALAGFEDLARRTGIKLALQLHGDTIHGSGAQAYLLLKDRDPAHIGAYPDPGNQVVQDGREDWRFTFEVLQPWLCCVGVKNGGWFPKTVERNGQWRWHSEWMGLADGMVPWADVLAHLAARRFAGLLSFHSHYEVSFQQVLDQTRLDLNFAKAAFAGSLGRFHG